MKSKKPKCGCTIHSWDGEFYLIDERPKVTWQLYPFCNDQMITINLVKAPNIFYRWMMTLFFGFRWKRVKRIK